MKDILIIFGISTEVVNWKSNPSSKLKRNFFRAKVETVLVYGSITWTLTSTLDKKKLIESIHACCVLH